ncbi:MAG TPA: phosphoglycerate kinase, partial [Parachlamydiales bacterium]|nr:phosphoglycerate kinase [Parachlamydiales bacterium]
MAYTFLKGQGVAIGDSIYEEKESAAAAEIIKEAALKKIPCHLPVDFVVADRFERDANKKTVNV